MVFILITIAVMPFIMPVTVFKIQRIYCADKISKLTAAYGRTCGEGYFLTVKIKSNAQKLISAGLQLYFYAAIPFFEFHIPSPLDVSYHGKSPMKRTALPKYLLGQTP